MTTMNTGMRTMSGVMFLIAEMTKLVQMSTAIVASPMERPLMALVVVARVGHIPRKSTKVGFSLIRPLRKTFIFCIVLTLSFYRLHKPG